VQRVIPDVGDSSNIMYGHSQDDVLSISPYKFNVVCRQANHCILLWCQLARQLMRLLNHSSAGTDEAIYSQQTNFSEVFSAF